MTPFLCILVLFMVKRKADSQVDGNKTAKTFGLVKDLGRCSHSTDRTERRHICKLAACCRKYLQERCQADIRSARNTPMLMSYSSDGTPIHLSKQHRASFMGKTVKAFGKQTYEFLMQILFIRHIDGLGKCRTSVLFGPPVSLAAGQRSAEHKVAARLDFFGTLRQEGHRDIAIQHYAFDRAGFEKQANLLNSFHHEQKSKFGKSSADSEFLFLLEWFVFTPCSLHDIHNSLKWALYVFFQDAALLKEMWVVFASLRNAFDLLVEFMVPWLIKVLVPCDDDDIPDSHYLFGVWLALGLEEDVARQLAFEMKLYWDQHAMCLKVSKHWASRSKVIEEVTGALWSLWRFKLFSDSRWITIGVNCRTLVIGFMTGLHSLVSLVRASDAVLASLVSVVPDSVLGMLMKDGRVPLNYEALKDKIKQRLSWLETLNVSIYSRIVSVISFWDISSSIAASGARFQSEVLHSAHLSASFIYARVLSHVEEHPWKLAVGDQDENLKELMQGPKPDEPTAGKIWVLLRHMHYSTVKIKMALMLLLDITWCTLACEQSHSLSATLKRLHPEMEVTSLLCRSMLLGFCKILPGLTNLEKTLMRLEAKLARLFSEQSQHITARNIFFGDLVNMSMSLKEHALKTISPSAPKLLMQKHAAKFQTLPEQTQRHYEDRAQIARLSSNEKAIAQRVEIHTEASKIVGKMRDEKSLRSPIVLSQCKLLESDENDLNALWSSDNYTEKVVAHILQQWCASPKPATCIIQHKLQLQTLGGIRGKRPFWLSSVCQKRHALKDCALVIDNGSTSYFKFLYAFQQPSYACFAPMTRETVWPEIVNLQTWGQSVATSDSYWFRFELGEFLPHSALPDADEAQLFVLPYTVRKGNQQVVSFGELVHFSEYMAAQEEIKEKATPDETDKKKKGSSSTASSSAPIPAALLAEMPWLTGSNRSVPSASSHMEPAEETQYDVLTENVPKQLSDNAFEALCFNLEDKRKEWAAQGVGVGTGHFRISMLGEKGTWTKLHKGRPYDFCMAFVKGEEPTAWIKRYFPKASARFDVDYYTESIAITLCKTWVHKMEYYYSIYLEQATEDYKYTEADHEGWEEPEKFTEAYTEIVGWGKKFAVTRVNELRALRPVS